MTSSARLLVLTSVSWIGLAEPAMADKCDALTTRPAAGRVWFYVRLIDAKTEKLIDVDTVQVKAQTAAADAPRQLTPNKSCFVPAVPKDAADVVLEVDAVHHVHRRCRDGDKWRDHADPNLPYECRLIPKPGSMADLGVTRVADLKDDKARKAAIAGIVEFASHFDPSEQPQVLARLSTKLNVRPGLLAQELLNRQGLNNCAGSACIAMLPPTLDKSFVGYLAANKEPLDAELLIAKRRPAISVAVTDPKLKGALLKLLDDPSLEAGFTVDGDNTKLKSYARAQFPETGNKIPVFVDAKFDPAVAAQTLGKF